jgi:hypothetical protein
MLQLLQLLQRLSGRGSSAAASDNLAFFLAQVRTLLALRVHQYKS